MKHILKLPFLSLLVLKRKAMVHITKFAGQISLKYVFVYDGYMTSVKHLQNHHVSMNG